MPDAPLRIVYVLTASYDGGGAERQVFDLAATFRTRGHGVGVVSMLPLGESFKPLADLGIRLASLEMTKGRPDPRAAVRLAKLLRAWRPHVVHAHVVHANLLVRIVRLLTPLPRVICTMHNQDEGAQWRYYAYRLADPLTDVTTTVSSIAVDEAVRRHAVGGSGLVLVPNGIRTEQYGHDETLRSKTRSSLGVGDAFLWPSVGRLTQAKRHTDLLEAMRIVHEAAPNVRLAIAGRGPLEAELEVIIERAGLKPYVSLLGLRTDVGALMQAADGFVMSSAWEGLPMVLLEASASSLPVVATDVGGSGEIVRHGETGFLTPARQPAELARVMMRMMALSTEERQAMGSRARMHVEREFDMEKVADRWEGLYRGSG